MARIQITPHIFIDENDLEESFVHAAGPGGQNVNKVATSVQLRFDVSSSGLPLALRKRLEKLAGRRLTKDGVIVIVARQFRQQERNRLAARSRLFELIRRASIVPRPRRVTKPPLAEKRRRLEGKKQRSDVKKLRQRPLAD